MGRLTYRNSQGRAFLRRNYLSVEDAVARKLAHYEDLEAQGRLIEITRCKDCKYFDNTDYSDDCGWCDCWYISVIGDEYCSQAKLKELKEGVE